MYKWCKFENGESVLQNHFCYENMDVLQEFSISSPVNFKTNLHELQVKCTSFVNMINANM